MQSLWYGQEILGLVSRPEIELVKLEHPRGKAIVFEVFKLLNGFDVAACNIFFHRSFTCLRGNKFKLYLRSFCTNLREFSFANRIIQDRIGIVNHSILLSSNTVEVFLMIG